VFNADGWQGLPQRRCATGADPEDVAENSKMLIPLQDNIVLEHNLASPWLGVAESLQAFHLVLYDADSRSRASWATVLQARCKTPLTLTASW